MTKFLQKYLLGGAGGAADVAFDWAQDMFQPWTETPKVLWSLSNMSLRRNLGVILARPPANDHVSPSSLIFGGTPPDSAEVDRYCGRPLCVQV